MTTKILLLGDTGQVGWELNRTLLTLGNLITLDYPQINMADPDCILQVMRNIEPAIVINATAYTDVDKAESEPELAMAVNGIGPGILAEEAKILKAALIHYSTDYVFDGTKNEPYIEEDQANPLNVYGSSKLAGEQAVASAGCAYLTFRTSWVYSLRRPCFVTNVLQWARENKTLHIVDDQVSSPTLARNLAEATAQIIAQGKDKPVGYIHEKQGLYHLAGGGSCSRFEWVKEILDLDPNKIDQVTKAIFPAKSNDFPTSATRPEYSALSCEKVEQEFGISIIHWQELLKLSLL